MWFNQGHSRLLPTHPQSCCHRFLRLDGCCLRQSLCPTDLHPRCYFIRPFVIASDIRKGVCLPAAAIHPPSSMQLTRCFVSMLPGYARPQYIPRQVQDHHRVGPRSASAGESTKPKDLSIIIPLPSAVEPYVLQSGDSTTRFFFIPWQTKLARPISPNFLIHAR